jgi:hypothetical protein
VAIEASGRRRGRSLALRGMFRSPARRCIWRSRDVAADRGRSRHQPAHEADRDPCRVGECMTCGQFLPLIAETADDEPFPFLVRKGVNSAYVSRNSIPDSALVGKTRRGQSES